MCVMEGLGVKEKHARGTKSANEALVILYVCTATLFIFLFPFFSLSLSLSISLSLASGKFSPFPKSRKNKIKEN